MPSLPITNDISLRPACKADFYTVAQNLRPADKAELVRTHGRADGALLEHFARYSTVCGVVAARGTAVGLWGLVPDGPPSARACVWLLTAGFLQGGAGAYTVFFTVISADLQLY